MPKPRKESIRVHFRNRQSGHAFGGVVYNASKNSAEAIERQALDIARNNPDYALRMIRSSSETSVGYSPKAAANWDAIFKAHGKPVRKRKK